MEILDPLIRLSCVSWAQVVLEEELQDELPYNEYYEYYAPDFTLHYPTNSSVENLNTRQYVDSVKHQVEAPTTYCIDCISPAHCERRY